MRRTAGVLLVLLSMISLPLAAQERGEGSESGQEGSGFQIQQNYPNPFNPETTIPFVLSEDLFADGGPVRVSMRIYNVLRQPVDAPVALNHPLGEGVELTNLEYSAPGRYLAFWDGKHDNGREVASGVYLLQVTVDGRSKIMKMYVKK